MRRYKSQTGAIEFSIVLFASLWIITMTVFFVYYAQWQSKKQDIQEYSDLKIQIEQKIERSLREQLQGLENITGFHLDTENRINMEKLINNLNSIADSDNEDNGQKKYGVYGLNSPEISQKMLTVTVFPINIETVLQGFESRIKELQIQEKVLDESITQISNSIANRTSEYGTIKSRHESRLKELTTEKSNLDEKYKNFINEVVTQIDAAKENQEKAEETRIEKREKLERKTLQYKNLISKRMSDIKLLQAQKYGGQKKQISEPKPFNASEEQNDGEIVFGNPLSNTLYISLGRKNKIFRGLKFDVFRKADRGDKEYKGRIEIKRVMDKISEAVVIDQVDELDPLVNGDIIVNPIFSQNRPVYVAFTDDKLKKARLVQFIKDIKEVGGIVEKKVSAKTNLVIIDNDRKGQGHRNYDDAVKFKIPLMDEQTLTKYVGDQ